MSFKNCYQILGVDRFASLEEIKQAYRKVALKYHPDKNLGSRWAESKFKEASEAYAILKDPNERKAYDLRENQTSAASTNNDGDFNDLFGNLFNNQSSKSSNRSPQNSYNRSGKNGSNIREKIAVSFTESVTGTEKHIQVKRKEICKICDGSGAKKGTLKSACPRCFGKGKLNSSSTFGAGKEIERNCDRCNGDGSVVLQPCNSCHGFGSIDKARTVKVKIPALIESGSQLRIPLQGHAGTHGGKTGDLFVEVHVTDHDLLKRKDYDLRCRVKISFVEATLGGDVRVPTLTGFVGLKIPRGTQQNQVFRLKELGIRKNEEERGDLLVTIEIDIPKRTSKKQEKLLREYEKLEELELNS